MLVSCALLSAAYFLGAIPFGYLIGRMRGVDLFREGSGNIGATNAGRVLGRGFGILVFLLDFLKGAVPVAAIVPLARFLDPGAPVAFGSPEILRVGAGALAFLGHLFPIYLRFRGGKGVATGAGTLFVLAPGPAALAVLVWVAVLLASRMVSLASLVAASILVIAWSLAVPTPFAPDFLPIGLFLFAGTLAVVLKHRNNVGRLLTGTEHRIGDFPLRETLVRTLHVLALGLWFGGAAFFNFVAAVPIFDSFKQVVNAGPSDRTAHQQIIDPHAPQEQKDALASALAGAAVGPIFPRFFALQATCGLLSFITALAWWHAGPLHRRRALLIGFALSFVAISWPLSNLVSELRLQRFDPDAAKAEAAKAAFGTWHFASLLLSFATTCLAGAALALAGSLPAKAPNSDPPSLVE